MKKLGLSKVMLSTLLAGGAMIGATSTSAEAPNEYTRGDTQIDLPPSAFIYPTTEETLNTTQEIKAEGEQIQSEREELARQLELEKIRLEQERIAKIEAEKVAAKKKSKQKSEEKTKTFEATYYTPYCKGCSGKTKSGHDARKSIYYDGMSIIAVDPKVIPLHSIVEITTGDKTYKAIALDTGGAIKGKRIDILVSDKKTAYKLGRHDVKVKIIRKGKSTQAKLD